MNTNSVVVADSPNQTNLRQVTVTASTNVPAWFMRVMGFNSTALTLTGQASRRDMVAMLVLDRSGSMCSINGGNPASSCGERRDSVRLHDYGGQEFTGDFAEGRDKSACLPLATAGI